MIGGLILSLIVLNVAVFSYVIKNDTFSCGFENSVKDNFLLGFDLVNQGAKSDYDEDLKRLKKIPIDFVHTYVRWSDIEQTKETYTDPYSQFSIYNNLCQSEGLKIQVTLVPVDIPGKFVPSDLMSTRFNDPVLINRFKSLLDYIFSKIGHNHLTMLQIGNEIDGYNPGGDVTFWDDYRVFLDEITQYIHTNFVGLKTGFTCTFDGLTENSKVARWMSWASVVDVIGCTYYTLEGDFKVKDPDLVGSDLDDLLSKITGIDIYMVEAGCHTSSKCKGSELKQGMFVCNMLEEINKKKSRIKSLLFVRYNELSHADAKESAKDYGLEGNEKFTEFLRTLGMRTYEGEDKLAILCIEDTTAAVPYDREKKNSVWMDILFISIIGSPFLFCCCVCCLCICLILCCVVGFTLLGKSGMNNFEKL